MKKQTFMQQYRQWQASGYKTRAVLTKFCIDSWGYSRAIDLDRYCEVACKEYTHNNVHTRINLRAAAQTQLGFDWHSKSADLNLLWKRLEWPKQN